jgi:hypothetical protein
MVNSVKKIIFIIEINSLDKKKISR